MNKLFQIKMRSRWTCPECGESARLKDSKRLPSGVEIFYLQCQEPACGWCGGGKAVTRHETQKSRLGLGDRLERRARHRARRDHDRPQWICAACGGPCIVRTSDRQLADYRVAYLRCRDEECQWRGIGHFDVLETISPSGIPNPAYKRRMAARLKGIYRLPPEDMWPETLVDD